MSVFKDMAAWYRFDDAGDVGKDSSGNNNNASVCGVNPPAIKEVNGRKAVCIYGDGFYGTSFLRLPENILSNASDEDGMCVTFWMNLGKETGAWERIFDFGKSDTGPYIFMTRNLRASCFAGSDLPADPGRAFPVNTWTHVALVVHGTKNGTLSSAGPVLYVNGSVIADGSISQTSSGNYKRLREWFAGIKEEDTYVNNYIGHSQFGADPDGNMSITDFRIYNRVLSESEIVDIVCETISDEDILKMVYENYLLKPDKIITEDIELPSSYMGGKVKVRWESEREDVLSSEGKLGEFTKPVYIKLTAVLSVGCHELRSESYVNVIPKITAPYTMTIHADKETSNISDTLYGLFYEDINNAADGGLYAELVCNRSFEAFEYCTYDASSGADGKSTGKRHMPLWYWFGDLDKITVEDEHGLNEHLGITNPGTNEHYITAEDGTVIYNRGFCDAGLTLSIYLKEEEEYGFTVWAKSACKKDGGRQKGAGLKISLVDENDMPVASSIIIPVRKNEWKKYGRREKYKMTASKTGYAQLRIEFIGRVSVGMVSLMPENVWGASEEKGSATAHTNFLGNPNYRLRRDMVEAMKNLHPSFLRFPGGCISEGSYIWDNVYDWKDSVGAVEYRKENYNVWGYMMTMGLGYMEYFQLAEDLGALPLPVMACGVLCQARSDYVNPAGDSLQDKYIRNFTDLIDFAISTDFDGNEWAELRKDMGHEEPFALHLLGVGNENWGEEFFASFAEFKYAIDSYMEKNYPGYDLTIISTVGAQADDDAYRYGWKFLSGNLETDGATVVFTDGEKSFAKEVKWYGRESNYMETIADEHYYRSNNYLLENADRYNYYYRAYNTDGTLNESETSKVFVGEYASTDKNTLAGAIAEAAVMTGFENNSDVVRLAATAPLFNKVLLDGTYRWTPDAIWFDNDSVWLTPNYYVQQMFAENLGKKVVETTFTLYEKGVRLDLRPHGGIEIAAGNAEVLVREINVISNIDNSVLFAENFSEGISDRWKVLPKAEGYTVKEGEGIIITPSAKGLNGIYILEELWKDYTVTVKAERISGNGGIFIGTGLTEIEDISKKDVIEYAVNMNSAQTGIRVFKQGVEGYTLGDYSSSVTAGNLRECNYEELKNGVTYTFTVNYGGDDGKHLCCSYTDGAGFDSIKLEYKLEAYNRAVFHSVTKDEEHLYAKLVNASDVSKKMDIFIDGYKQVYDAKAILLTAGKEFVDTANVNTKEEELVKPCECRLAVNEQKVQVILPAHSVTVLVF